MLHSFDRGSCILLAFALSKITLALTANSSFPANGTKFDTVAVPTSVSSATTLTTDGFTFTFLPSASVGAGEPTTIVQNGETIVSSASLLIIPAPSPSSSASSSFSQSLTSTSKNATTSSIASRISSSSLVKSNSSTALSTSSRISAGISTSPVISNSSTIVSKSSTASQTGTTRSLSSSSSSLVNSNVTSSTLSRSSGSISKSGSQSTSSSSTGSSYKTSSSSTGSPQSASTSSNSTGATPSSSSTLPISTSSGSTSTGPASTSSAAPINQQPVISTLTSVVSGTTQLVPVIIGGAFTTPVPVATTAPPTSLVATGTIASSSASALSSKLNVGVIPIINIWTNNPAKDKGDDAINAIKGILPEAENLLNSLGGDKGSSPCSGSTKRDLVLIARGLIPDPLKIASDIVHSVACITNSLSKITGEIEQGTNAVKGVLADVEDLTSLTNNLDEEEKGDDDNSSDHSSNSDSKTSESKSSTSESSSSSSSSSCTQTSVTQDLYVECFPTTVSGSTSQVTQTCTTSTSTVSGCSVTAFSTTTTSSGTANIATNVATITPDPEFSGTVDFAHFSSLLAGFEASGVNGNVTGSGTIIANATTSASNVSTSSSQISVSTSGKTASPTPTSSASTVSKTSSQATITSSATSSTITACSFYSTVFPSSLQSIAGTGTQRYCTCGDMMAGINLATSGTKTTSYCATGGGLPTGWTQIPASNGLPITSTTKTPDPPKTTTTPPPPPPYQTGTCSLHIYEGAWDGSSPIDMTAEIKDGGGNSLATAKQSPNWGGTVTLGKSDSKLPYDVVITFATTTSSKRSLFNNEYSAKFKRICCEVAPPPRPNYAYESRLVKVQAGSTSVDSSQTDDTKMPHMDVGGWDNNGAPPNRQMDAYWSC